MEHGSIGDSEMHAMIPSIVGAGISPIVRVPAPENTYVKRALDAGAHGLMFPMIETKASAFKLVWPTYSILTATISQQEQAQAVVRMCKFPPAGIRGVGSPFAPALFGKTVTGYQDIANDATLVIVQIETVLGIKNAAEIASVPGIGQAKLSHTSSGVC
jgi:4-hydroxy-2-oxoheptanedioate aldolase